MSTEEESKSKLIGDMNGKWAILFKAQLALGAFVLPMLVPWAVWVTGQVFEAKSQLNAFTSAGPRYTADQAVADGLRLRRDIIQEIAASYPPQWLRDEIASISRRQGGIEADIEHIKRNQEKD
jgi:hypothetical protein